MEPNWEFDAPQYYDFCQGSPAGVDASSWFDLQAQKQAGVLHVVCVCVCVCVCPRARVCVHVCTSTCALSASTHKAWRTLKFLEGVIQRICRMMEGSRGLRCVSQPHETCALTMPQQALTPSITLCAWS